MDKKICAKCGSPNEPNANFCTNCGSGEFAPSDVQKPAQPQYAPDPQPTTVLNDPAVQNAYFNAQQPQQPAQPQYAPPQQPQAPQQPQYAAPQQPQYGYNAAPQQPQYGCAPQAPQDPPKKKKSPVVWIVAAVLVLAIIGAVLWFVLGKPKDDDDGDKTSSKNDKTEEVQKTTGSGEDTAGKTSEAATGEGPATTEEQPKTDDKPADLDPALFIGDWEFDVDFSGVSKDELWDMLGGNIPYGLKELLSADEFSGILQGMFKGCHMRFSDDGSVMMLVDVSAFRNGMIRIYDATFSKLGSMNLEQVAQLYGESVDQLRENLDQTGKTWKELCSDTNESNRAQLEATSDRILAESFGCAYHSNGIAVASDEERYTVEGDAVVVSGKGSRTTFRYGDSVLRLSEISARTGGTPALMKVIKDLTLKKAASVYRLADSPEPVQETSEEDPGPVAGALTNTSVAGDWQFAVSASDVDKDKAWEYLASDSFFGTIEGLIDRDDVSGFIADVCGAYRYRFYADGTVDLLLEISVYREALKDFYEVVFSGLAEVGVSEGAQYIGVSEDDLKSALDAMGMTWSEYCDQFVENTVAQIDSTSDEDFAAQLNGGNVSGGFAEMGNKDNYSISGDKVSMVRAATSLTYRDGYLVLDGPSLNADEDSAWLINSMKIIKLRKVA